MRRSLPCWWMICLVTTPPMHVAISRASVSCSSANDSNWGDSLGMKCKRNQHRNMRPACVPPSLLPSARYSMLRYNALVGTCSQTLSLLTFRLVSWPMLPCSRAIWLPWTCSSTSEWMSQTAVGNELRRLRLTSRIFKAL